MSGVPSARTVRRGLDAVLQSLFGTLTDVVASAAAAQVVEESAQIEKSAPGVAHLFPSHSTTITWVFNESYMRAELMHSLGLDRLAAERVAYDRALLVVGRCTRCGEAIRSLIDETALEWMPSSSDAASHAYDEFAHAVDAHACPGAMVSASDPGDEDRG